jgi:hypothetical protein
MDFANPHALPLSYGHSSKIANLSCTIGSTALDLRAAAEVNGAVYAL